VSAQLITHFGDKVFRTIIPRNIRLAEAPSFGKPVLFHDKESRGALSYLALAGEMIRREEEVAPPPAEAVLASAVEANAAEANATAAPVGLEGAGEAAPTSDPPAAPEQAPSYAEDEGKTGTGS
jgi:hypothetical protein